MRHVTSKLAYRIAGSLAACLMCLSFTLPVRAEDTAHVLQINYGQDTDDGFTSPIPGADFSVYQVAELTADGYEYVDPYKTEDGNNILELPKDGKELEALAKTLSQTANKNAQTGVTDANGQASFPAQEGIYLVVQTGSEANSTASKYIKASPFLVQVPGADEEAVTKVFPKTEKIKEVPAVTPPPSKPSTTSTTPNTSTNTSTTGTSTNTSSDGNTQPDESSVSSSTEPDDSTTENTNDTAENSTNATTEDPIMDTSTQTDPRTEQTGDSPVPVILLAAGCAFLLVGAIVNRRTGEKK